MSMPKGWNSKTHNDKVEEKFGPSHVSVDTSHDILSKSVLSKEKVEVKKITHKGIALWICVFAAMLITLDFAYTETTRQSSLDMVLPQVNVTLIRYENGSIVYSDSDSRNSTFLSVPQIPRFVLLWGFIGAAAYVLKVVAIKMAERTYDDSYIPFHISRLILGPALAAATYFLLITGSIFGISIDISKIQPPLLPYVYALIAFVTGYFVRAVIDTLSNLINSIFHLKD
jgi:hypothetical protein